MELTDDELSQVSGGRGPSHDSGFYYCIYCNTEHLMNCFFPFSFRPADSTRTYATAAKYICSVKGSFYTLALTKGGAIRYFDSDGNLLR